MENLLDPLDPSRSPEEAEAAWEATWRADQREVARMLGEADDYFDDVPYDPAQDGRRPEVWDRMWREVEADLGREWSEKYSRHQMVYVLMTFYGVELPEDWEPPPPLTPDEIARFVSTRKSRSTTGIP